MEALDQIAKFAAETTYETLPGAVVERARWVMRDTVGVIIAGLAEPEVQRLATYAAQTAAGQVTLFGHGGRTTPAWAVMVHGTAGTTLEMDEGHAFARGHAAVHALPPALALAEVMEREGRTALTAFVVGYEIAARAGIATRLRYPVHPFGTWGVLGSAAAAAWTMGYDPPALAGTLELAASYAITPSFYTAYQGANVRNTFAGMVNQLGLVATELYRLGFRGERGALQTVFGQIIGESFEPALLVDGLGTRYEMLRGYFKPYSACRYVHGAVDAALQLRAETPFAVAEVEHVEVATYDIAARLSDPAPKTPLAGRFSLPFVLAATLVHGSAGPEIFTPDSLADPAIVELAGKVRVVEEQAFTALTPARRPARVTLVLKDGSRRQRTVMGSKGDPDRPMTAEELEAKFLRLTAPRLGPDRASRAWEQLGKIDSLARLDELIVRLTPSFTS